MLNFRGGLANDSVDLEWFQAARVGDDTIRHYFDTILILLFFERVSR